MSTALRLTARGCYAAALVAVAVIALQIGEPARGQSPARSAQSPPGGGGVSGSFGDRSDAYLSFSITGANLKLRPGTPASYEGSWAGGPITLSGEMTVARGAGAVSYVTMSANLAGKSWRWPPEGEDGKVQGRTVSQRFNLTFTVPTNYQGSEVTGGARLDVCGGACGVYAVDFRISLSRPKSTPPVVRAFAPGGTAEPGKKVSLEFSVVDDSGRATVHLSLYQGGTQLWTSSPGPGPATGKRQAATFRLSSSLVGPLSFCVWAEDAEGNKSRGSPKSSCASIKFQTSNCSLPKRKYLARTDGGGVARRAEDECPPEVAAIAPSGTIRPGASVRLAFSVSDDSGKARFEGTLFQGGTPVAHTKSRGLVAANGEKRGWTINLAPGLKGPLFFCFWAEDAAGNRTSYRPNTGCGWLPMIVPIESVSNGCGGEGWDTIRAIQNYFGNTHSYVDSWVNPAARSYPVNFVEACNLHDAGYAGVMVPDSINGGFIDYRRWSRKAVDTKFYKDMLLLCDDQILAKATAARQKCRSTGGALSFGAGSLFRTVRDYGHLFFDADLTLHGVQKLGNPKARPSGGVRDNG